MPQRPAVAVTTMELGEKAFSLGPVTVEAMKELSEGKVVQVIGADKPVWKGDSLAEWTSDPSKQEEYGAEVGTMTRTAAGLVCKYGSGVETYGWEGDVAFDSVEALYVGIVLAVAEPSTKRAAAGGGAAAAADGGDKAVADESEKKAAAGEHVPAAGAQRDAAIGEANGAAAAEEVQIERAKLPAPFRNVDYSPSEGVARSKVLSEPFAGVQSAGSTWIHFPRVKQSAHKDPRAPPMRVASIDMSTQYMVEPYALVGLCEYVDHMPSSGSLVIS